MYQTIADRSGNYKIFDLVPGLYRIWAYENLNIVNNSYFNGRLDPLEYAAKFNYYNETIETRAKWDIEDVIITIK